MDQYIGSIQMFGFNFPPTQMAYCNGQLLAISQNTALFALIGTTFGGNGQSTFALPNLQASSMVHPGTGPGLSSISWGQVGGAVSQTMLVNNMPPHIHNVAIGVNTEPGEEAAPTNVLAQVNNEYSTAAAPPNVLGGVNQQIVGANDPFTIANPYLGVNFCIALQGIFPPRN